MKGKSKIGEILFLSKMISLTFSIFREKKIKFQFANKNSIEFLFDFQFKKYYIDIREGARANKKEY